MKKILIVVDMQNDFIDGALGTPEAEAIVENVKAKIRSYPVGCVYATMDTHSEDYLNTQEGKYLPVKHCIKGTPGWEIRPDIAALLKDAAIYEKPTFGCTKLAEDLRRQVEECRQAEEMRRPVNDLDRFANDQCQQAEEMRLQTDSLEQSGDSFRQPAQECGMEIELVGLCTDICVVSNALLLKAYMPEVPVSVDASCCAGVTPEKHKAALETMRSCQIAVKDRRQCMD